MDQNKTTIGGFTFDATNRTLTINDSTVKLTTKENGTLKALHDRVNVNAKREDILNEVWGTDSYFAGRSLDVYIAKLRKYLKADPSVTIQNIHGEGFKLLVQPKN